MRIKKFLSGVLATILCLSAVCIPAFADTAEGIVPYSNNVSGTATVFVISSTGLATVKAEYTGIRGVTSGAVITSQIQKKSGTTWTNVPGGYWSDTISGYRGSTSHSLQLSSHGTYRAVVVYKVSGSGGATDVIEQKPEYTW